MNLSARERARVAERIAAHVIAMHIAGGALLLLVLTASWDAATGGRLRR